MGQYINDQNGTTGALYEYGAFSASYNMCEIIAIHNARVLLNQNNSTLSETAFVVQNTGAMTPAGIFGSNPYMLGEALGAFGIDYTPVSFDEMNQEGVYIISFWNSDSVFDQLHTVAVRYDGKQYTTYNLSGNGKTVDTDPAIYVGAYVYGYYLGNGDEP